MNDKINPRSNWLYLLIAIILGCIIRITNLNLQSLWLDELYSVTAASYTFSKMWSIAVTDVHPPLYQLFLWSWVHIFGNSEISVRFPSVIVGIVALPCLFYFYKNIYNKYIATTGTILLSLTYYGIYFSQEARPYSFLLLFSVITTSYFVRLSSKPTNRDLLIYTIAALVTAQLHYFGAILIFCQVLYLLLIKKQLSSLISLCVIGLSYLPWVFVILYTMHEHSEHFWIPTRGLSIVGEYLSAILYNQWYAYLLAVTLLLIFPLISIKKAKIDWASNYIPLIYTVISVPLAALIVGSITHIQILDVRNLIVIAPATYILLSRWISNLKLPEWKQNAYVLVVCLMCLALFSSQYYSPQQEQWREATRWAIDQSDNNSLIVASGYADYFQYYSSKQIGSYHNISDAYLNAITADDNKLIVLSCNYTNITQSDGEFMTNHSLSNTSKYFVGTSVHIYEL